MWISLRHAFVILVLCCWNVAGAGSSPVATAPALTNRTTGTSIKSYYVTPTRVVWKSASGVENAETLLREKPRQPVLKDPSPPCLLRAGAGGSAGILLDFGVELNGYVELFTPLMPSKEPMQVRIRFGESVSEAMSDLGGRQNSQNDHAIRDQVISLPWLGKITVGPSGFRFVRIDALDPKTPAALTQVRAVLELRDAPYLGSFRCNDERLNRIWDVGAYTVHLNMQDYLWDGIKRDRLVWVGDMHPEVSTIHAVFGFNEVVPLSLDLIRDVTPPTEWMNGISSYSMWWVLIHEEMWLHQGDRDYLNDQKQYLQTLLRKLARSVDLSGREILDGHRFLDWPTSENKAAIHAGLQALLVLALQSGERLMTVLKDPVTARICQETVAKMRRYSVPSTDAKQAAALLALAGLRDPKEIADGVLKAGGPRGLSTFYGFYVLQALSKAGETETALDFIRQYWGGMLEYGATTFWEDFDLNWTENAARIDELVPAGKKDLHGDCGAYCYEGFRHSLCHGWASGPTAWLSQHVLGVQVLEPGATRVRVVPQLGHLQWAEGTYPTPQGIIKVRHERQDNGKIKSRIEAPRTIRIERK